MRAYLRLRRLHERRIAPLPRSAASGAVIRGFAGGGRAAGVAARKIVETYRAEAFGGISPGPEGARELRRLLRELAR